MSTLEEVLARLAVKDAELTWERTAKDAAIAVSPPAMIAEPPRDSAEPPPPPTELLDLPYEMLVLIIDQLPSGR